MSNAQNTESEAVVVRRVFRAPVATVYRFWSDPERAKRWSWGSEFDTVSIDLECETGGEWHQHIRHRTTGENWFFDGVFVEVVPERRLVHTFHFRSDRGKDEPPSLVTIEFLPQDRSTEVVLTHTRLTPEKRGETDAGWKDIFEVLEGLVTTGAA